MSDAKTSNAKITEALELLNEAAQEKKEELNGLLTDKYSYIKETIAATTQQGKQMFDQAKNLTQVVTKEADKRVRENPWPYVASAAAFSFLLGYLMGSKKK